MSASTFFRAVGDVRRFLDIGLPLSAALARAQSLHSISAAEVPLLADFATRAVHACWRARALRTFDDIESPRRSRATNSGRAPQKAA